MKLLGAKEFVFMPKGTFFKQIWTNYGDCLDKMQQFRENPESFYVNKDLQIYGDNFGSVDFRLDEEDLAYYWDLNVFGDASPMDTLYLVFEEDELFDKIVIGNEYGCDVVMSKPIYCAIRDKFTLMLNPLTKEQKTFIMEMMEEEASYTSKCNLSAKSFKCAECGKISFETEHWLCYRDLCNSCRMKKLKESK